ncbi:SusC/RagA family TonB-linked outer membrane protein [Maribacter sp. 2307ULW6-5]|uniref:SusC/RagA family TonB-linked outer membrane protein n=1 Tax=Maribacter sp. 2307ULW6-5 TaxID=3386275 RepID=UPI0039BCA86C
MKRNPQNKHRSYLLFFIIFLVFGTGQIWAQSNQFAVSGNVTSSQDGTPLPGVSIVLQGSTKGVVTDFDGNYSLEVQDGEAVLIFSYLGFKTQEVPVGGRSRINVALTEDAQALDEVVVTALGIKREDKSLGYSVEKVQAEELTRVVNENVLNSISGKVSGVTINSTGGTGSSVSMVIRGATSLSSDNQPLFVVDGVPVVNTVNNVGGFGDRVRVDYGNAISDLDPESIENVTILKGPSAAALYGSRAGNGVVLITTKSAEKGKKMKVSFTNNTVADIPFRYLNVQSRFASGFFSFRPEDVGGGVLPNVSAEDGTGAGPELDRGYWAVQWNAPLDANGQPIPTELKSYPNNIGRFVQTGLTTTNSLAITNSSDLVNYRLGVSNMTHTGMIPNSDLNRNSYSLSASSSLNEKLTISTNVNLNHSWADNRPVGNRGANPLQWAYAVPANIDIRELEDYWVPGKEGLEVRSVSSNHENPYFLANEVNNSFNRYRIFGNVMAEWEISPAVSLMARYNLNKYDETRETKMAPGYTREPNNGAYGISSNTGLERNIDFLATYRRDFGKLDISVSGGGNLMYQKDFVITNSSLNGTGLVVPNLYTVSNISPTSLNFRSVLNEKSIQSIYGLANFGWNDMLYLDLTARNDWSSTLPVENRSYFYPSASLSFLLSEVIKMPKLDFLKLRAGWAQVGNDTSPYRLNPVFVNSGQWGDVVQVNVPGNILTPELKPEEATSLEFGMDMRAFGNRFRFEGTYYNLENRNQIIGNIPLAVSSGFNSANINAGLIESEGIEILIGFTPIQTKNWQWDLDFNFTRNVSTIIELSEGVDFIEFWSDNRSRSLGFAKDLAAGQDGLVGNIYAPKIRRVTDTNSPYFGYPLIGRGLDAEWLPEEELSKVGNYNPDFIMGLQTQLRFKNLSLNMTFDWRSGGQYMSQTHRYMSESVLTQTWLDNLVNPGDLRPGQELRDWVIANEDELLLAEDFRPVGGPTPEYGGFPEEFSGVVVNDGTFAPGVVGSHDENGNFILEQENLGGEGTVFLPYVVSFPWDFGTPNMFDADYIKLREVALTYTIPNKIFKRTGLDNMTFSIYSRNIMLWTKDSDFGIDPERAFQIESSTGNRGTQFKQGIERYNVDPWVVPIGFKVGLTF